MASRYNEILHTTDAQFLADRLMHDVLDQDERNAAVTALAGIVEQLQRRELALKDQIDATNARLLNVVETLEKMQRNAITTAGLMDYKEFFSGYSNEIVRTEFDLFTVESLYQAFKLRLMDEVLIEGTARLDTVSGALKDKN